MSRDERSGFLEMLQPDVRHGILARARIVRARKGQTLLACGERSTNVFVVAEGRFQVVLYSAAGREVSLRELGEGELFGELAAIDGEDRSVAVVAASEARLMAITQADFLAALRASPEASQWLLARLARRVRGLTEKVFELAALNVQSRLYCELLRMAHGMALNGLDAVDPAPTHNELANRIGSHREAVTREMKALADDGIIRSGRRRLEFLDVAKLEDRVGRALQRGPNLAVDT